MVNMVIEAGTSIFFKWYFDPVHLAKYGPTVIKFEVLGSYLTPPGININGIDSIEVFKP